MTTVQMRQRSVRLADEIASNLNLMLAFPPRNLALTFVGIMLLALLITLVPIRCAVHLRPGYALRSA